MADDPQNSRKIAPPFSHTIIFNFHGVAERGCYFWAMFCYFLLFWASGFFDAAEGRFYFCATFCYFLLFLGRQPHHYSYLKTLYRFYASSIQLRAQCPNRTTHSEHPAPPLVTCRTWGTGSHASFCLQYSETCLACFLSRPFPIVPDKPWKLCK